MRVCPGYLLRSFYDDNLVIGPTASDGSRKVVRLNASAAFLWRKVCGGEFDTDDLAVLLEGEYGLEPGHALADAESVAAQWLENGIVLR